jgi:tetratricopeptide (TPR) repeat protein
MNLGTGGIRQAVPGSMEIRRLLDQHKPATVLSALEGEDLNGLEIYRAEALLELDRLKEAFAVLDPLVYHLHGKSKAEAEWLRSVMVLRLGWVDSSILSALKAAEVYQEKDSKAAALAWSAVGLQIKGCWKMAEANLREAIELAPNAPRVLMAQARVRLEADQRIEAREVYERMARMDSTWAQVHGLWGSSYVAYLLGEFDEAAGQAEAALEGSDEVVFPLFILGRVALAKEDEGLLAGVLNELKRRSSMSESLPALQVELEGLRLRKAGEGGGKRKRLEAFPTLMQRRDYCGPSTVELVMRYWKGMAGYTNDQIAEKVKIAQSGTPMYRMREFFHLSGFDTVRTLVPPEKLKQLIEAGFPVIIQEEFSNTAHVAVAIGFDDEAEVIELQDPMTHMVTRTPEEELNQLRQIYLDGGLIAFPRGRILEKTLRRMGFFDHPALVWCDQAVLELDQNHFAGAVVQAEKAVKKLPALRLGWVLLLLARLESWKWARDLGRLEGKGFAARKNHPEGDPAREERERFYAALSGARQVHPLAEFIYQFEGSAAFLDQDFSVALDAFQRAVEIDVEDARNYASMAECYFALGLFDKANQAAQLALEHAPGLPAANAWIARAQAALGQKNAVHYARMALDLSPDWWVAHQALAEAHLQENQLMEARREVEQALSLAPGQPEAEALRGVVLWRMHETAKADAELHAVLDKNFLHPVTVYQVHQSLARISFEAGLFEGAEDHARELLRLKGKDPWAVQLLAAVHCELALKQPGNLDEIKLAALVREYEQAVQMNQGETGVIRDYLDYLEALAGLSASLAALQKLRTVYPEKGSLIFLQGSLFNKAGNGDAALACMREALAKPDGVLNRDELGEAAALILKRCGLEEAERDLLEGTVPEGGPSRLERQRAFGLALARLPERYGGRARELLLMTLAEQSEDAEVILRLGDVAVAEEDREQCYRQALMLAPNWSFARSHLAEFLIESSRETEALDFTTGHEQESSSMLITHGRALFGLGHYEEAASTFEQAVEQDGLDDAFLLANLWMAQLRSGMHNAALKTARLGTRQFTGDPRWYVRVGAVLRELGRFDEARLALEKALRKGLSTAEALRAEYEIARLQQDDEIALQVIEDLLSLPDEQEDDGKLGWTERHYLHLLASAGRTQEVRQFIERQSLSVDGWAEAAWAIQDSGQNELQLELAEKALALDPSQIRGLLARAEALSRLGREAEAQEAFQSLLEEHPDEHSAYEKLALWLAAAGDLDKAFDYAEQAVELGIFCPTAWATRGFLHALRGDLPAALDDLQAGWRRADRLRGKKQAYFWWLLAALEGEIDLAEERKYQAFQECRTELEVSLLRMIERMLAD